MTSINQLFRKRIGYPEAKPITFENLEELLTKIAYKIPFENLCIIKNDLQPISEKHLIEKVLIRNEGGLCYEINPLFYLFLLENGFSVTMVQGAVYDQKNKTWSETGRTHVTILLENNHETYLVDSGFGGNIPLKPVPLNGETVMSANGEFRVVKQESPYGDYHLEMKRRDKDNDWTIGYAFDSNQPANEFMELEKIQNIIVESEASAFNKGPLLTKLTEHGSMVLTKDSFTVWNNGRMTKEKVDSEAFKKLAKEQFGISE